MGEDKDPPSLQSLAVDVGALKVEVAWLKRLMVPNFIVTILTLVVAVLGVIMRLV